VTTLIMNRLGPVQIMTEQIYEHEKMLEVAEGLATRGIHAT